MGIPGVTPYFLKDLPSRTSEGMMRELYIGGRRIADDEPPYVVAEIGANHMGDVDIAKALILAAATCGCDAVKFQKRDMQWWAERHPEWGEPYESEHSFAPTYIVHRMALEFGTRTYELLRAYADYLGIQFFATAFDPPSVAVLDSIGVPAIKIASGCITDDELLNAAVRADVPLIVSTGGATLEEVELAVMSLERQGADHALLQCTSMYPVRTEDQNLRVISLYRTLYPDRVIGLSDHDPRNTGAIVAYALGARIIEKHFTLDRSWKGTDQQFSLEPSGMRWLVRDLRDAHAAMGDGMKRRLDGEIPALVKQGRSELLEVR